MAAADAVGRKSAFRRGLNATRLTVAFAVTVLIILIVAYAVTVVSRTEKLSLTVTGGIIYVEREGAAGTNDSSLALTFVLQANNPGGRVRFYYTDIHAQIQLNNTPFTNFRAGDSNHNMFVAPDSMLQTDVYVNRTNVSLIAPYFNQLYNSNSASIRADAMLRLNGTLTVGLYSVHNKTSDQGFLYYCWPLTMGAIGNASAPDVDDSVLCGTNDPTK